MKTPNYTIIVNSCDAYEDCWYPFFKLFSKFWPTYNGKIILNTEKKEFQYSGLKILCSKVGINAKGRKIPWGEQLLLCLNMVDTQIILYLQDDYFINAPVDSEQLDEFVEFMIKNNVSYVGLVQCNIKLSTPSDHLLLWNVAQNAKYRLSLQAALWRKERLLFYLKKHWNPRQFEIWGSRQARHTKDTILCVNKEIFTKNNRNAVMSYRITGIERGRWRKDIVYDLFRDNEINVDFSKRGFYYRPYMYIYELIQKIRARLPW